MVCDAHGCDEHATNSLTMPNGAPLAQDDVRWGTQADTRRLLIIRVCPLHWREIRTAIYNTLAGIEP